MVADDQRASKRFGYEAPVIIKNCDCGTYAYGRMYNYSRGGLYLESDAALHPGTHVRIDIEASHNGPAVDHYYATVQWCTEISAAVVLYDYGIGLEFDRAVNGASGPGKLRIIQGGAGRQNAGPA
ncbi:MAG: PilZ domain-containing protein [Desulfobacterales bacterium]